MESRSEVRSNTSSLIGTNDTNAWMCPGGAICPLLAPSPTCLLGFPLNKLS